MDAPMDIGTSSHQHPQPLHQTFNTQHSITNANASEYWPASLARICLHASLAVPVLTEMDRLYEQMRVAVAGAPQSRDPFRDIPVKVHIRRPERDTWAYMGRGIVSQEISGQSSRVGAQTSPFSAPPHASLTDLTRPVVRAASSSKILTVFGQVRHHLRTRVPH